jgi:hypothetical protein
MSYVDIKDRIADGDDIFRVEALGDGRIRLIPEPNSVTEKGTPINKQLLQPLVDAQNVVDISDDFCTDVSDGVIKGLEKQIYKMGNIISGFIRCDFVEEFEDDNAIMLEDHTLLDINKKYIPKIDSNIVIATAVAVVESNNTESPGDYIPATVLIDTSISVVMLTRKVWTIFMYFHYICKGDEENDN